jgi:hypothetical protein
MSGTIGRCAEALGAIGGGAVAATALARNVLATALVIAVGLGVGWRPGAHAA